MEQPGGVVDKSDHHVVNISASNPDGSSDQLPTPLSIAARTRNSSALMSSPVRFRQLQLALVAVQIVASVVGLACSTHEKPQPDAPFRALIAVYAIGCVAALPPLCWDYHSHPDRIPAPVVCFHRIIQFETVLSLVAEDGITEGTTASRPGSENPRMVQELAVCWRIVLNVFFAFWLFIAGFEIISARSSSATAPILFRLCVVFFAVSCFGHALGFIIQPMLRLILAPQGGASPARINTLPAHTFKLKGGAGGVVAPGTDKERVISGDDAVCSICLATYADGDELRELPCAHLLHRECVDKWLKIKATCPLCKSAIRPTVAS